MDTQPFLWVAVILLLYLNLYPLLGTVPTPNTSTPPSSKEEVDNEVDRLSNLALEQHQDDLMALRERFRWLKLGLDSLRSDSKQIHSSLEAIQKQQNELLQSLASLKTESKSK